MSLSAKDIFFFFGTLLLWGKSEAEKRTMYESYLNDYAFIISDPMNASSFSSRRRGVLGEGDGGTCVL